jgi:threonine dehydrogenase-like Zn-dependent dehydrogenase
VDGAVAYMSSPGNVELRRYPLPDPEPGAALARVRCANICGSEVHIFSGHHPILKQSELGHEMVGEIVALGEGVTTDSAGRPLAVGDRIAPVYFITCMRCRACSRGQPFLCQHAYDWWTRPPDDWPHFHATLATHYYLPPEQRYYRIPDNLPDEAASVANCALSQVLFGLDRAAIAFGETVLVQGAGGLGLCAVAVARERGARVIVIDGVDSRLELAAKFGADEIIDLRAVPTVEERVERVMEWSDGGVDVGVEVAGVPDAFSEGIRHVRPGGRYVEMGNIIPGPTTAFDPGLYTRRSVTMYAVNRYDPWYLDTALQFLSRVHDRYPFSELAGETFALSAVEEALARSADRSVTRAMVVPESV